MTILLQDLFTGSGAVNGRIPSTTLGGLAWASDPGFTMSVASGYAVNDNTTIGGDGGYMSIGSSVATYTATPAVEIGFSLKTGANITPGATRFGIYVSWTVSGINGAFSLLSDASQWTLGYTGGSSAVVTLAANTEYYGTLSVTDGLQTLTFLGQTITGTAPYISSTGFDYIDISIGDVFKLGPLTVTGTEGSGASITLPALTAQASGSQPSEHGASTMQLPALLVSAAGGSAGVLTAPTLRLSATGHDSAGERSFAGGLPALALQARGGANSELSTSALTLAATGTTPLWGHVDAELPAPLISASGKTAATGRASLSIMPTLVGYSGAVLSVTLQDSFSVQATGTAGSVGGAALTLPLFDLVASGTARAHGGASLALPALTATKSGAAWLVAPGATLTAVGTAVVAVSYEAYALNLNHRNPDSPDELTRYTNYPFDRIVRYENSYFGMNATGLYLLEGTTDFAEPTPTKVPWRFKTGLTDFESPNLKTVNWAYFGGRMAPAATISIHYGDTGEQNYAYSTPRGAEAQNYRQPFGRGIKSRYYAVEAEGSGALSIDSMMFDIASMARKV